MPLYCPKECFAVCPIRLQPRAGFKGWVQGQLPLRINLMFRSIIYSQFCQQDYVEETIETHPLGNRPSTCLCEIIAPITMSRHIQYSKLGESCSPDLEPCLESPPTVRQRISSKVPACLTTLLALTGLFIVAVFGSGVFLASLDRYVRSPQSTLQDGDPQLTSPPTITQCGTTPAEARALGCRFELHNFAWVPPACYDEALVAPWDAREEWVFATQGVGTGIDENQRFYTRAEAASGDLASAWVPWAQHMSHCGLVFQKFQRAVRAGWQLDNWTSSYAHTAHCASNMELWFVAKDAWQLNSELFLKFPKCDYSWQERGLPEEIMGVGVGVGGHHHHNTHTSK